MAGFIRGDVVVVPFPFSDLSETKRRPALVLANLRGDDYILCQITSQAIEDEYSISLVDEDFVSGSLKRKSQIRPNRLFTADRRILLYKVGQIKKQKIDLVINQIIQILRSL